MRWLAKSRVFIGCILGGFTTGFAFAAEGKYWAVERWISDKPWEVVSALGTLAAAAIALWIALRDGAKRKKTEAYRASLVAARITVTLELLSEHGRELDLLLEKVPRLIENRDGWYKALQEKAERPIPAIAVDDLWTLAPLAHNAASRIARGISLLETVRNAIRTHEPLIRGQDVPRNALEQLSRTLRVQAIESRELLLVAHHVCKEAAHIGG